jgi:general secretion pathway protein L
MPSYVIGLDLGSSCVKAAVLKGSFRGYEVEDFLSLEAAELESEPDPAAGAPGMVELSPREERDGEQEGEQEQEVDEQEAPASVAMVVETPQMAAVRKVLAAVGHPQALVVVSIPAGRASAWQVDLPFSDRKRIEQTIGFELENYVPWDLDDVVLDYEVMESSGDGARVFAVMVPRERVGELLANLRRYKVDPRFVTVDAAELARLVPPSDECEVVLDIGSSRTLICVVQDGRPLWIRSLDVGADSFGDDVDLGPWLLQVRASLIAAEESGAPTIDAALLCGGGSRIEGICEELAEDLGIDVELLELPESPVNPDMAPQPEPEHALAYALALKGFAARDRVGTNLRKGEFSWKADSRLYTRLAFAGVAAMMLLCVGFVAMHFVKLAEFKGRLEDANSHLSATVLGAFPHVSPAQVMTPDGAVQVMQEQVTGVQWRVEALEGHSVTPLEALKELSDTVPAGITIDLDEFLANDELIRIRGTTDSFGSVDKIEAAILDNPIFAGAKKSDVNKARDGKMRFVVTIPREQEEEVGG